MMTRRKVVLVLVFHFMIFKAALSSHFRGAIIMVRPRLDGYRKVGENHHKCCSCFDDK